MSLLNDPEYIIQKMRLELLRNNDKARRLIDLLDAEENEYVSSLVYEENLCNSPEITHAQEFNALSASFDPLTPSTAKKIPSASNLVQIASKSNVTSRRRSRSAIDGKLGSGHQDSPQNIDSDDNPTTQNEHVDPESPGNDMVDDQKIKVSSKDDTFTKLLIDSRKISIGWTESLPDRSSMLSKLIMEKGKMNNPFSEAFRLVSGGGCQDALKLKIWLTFSTSKDRPMEVTVRRKSTVDEVIGYILCQYIDEGKQPTPIPHHGVYILRIVEDDGTVDEDFPALERSRKIQKFAFDQFALCIDTDAERKYNAMKKAAGGKTKGRNIFLKIHVYSTLEVKQTTTVNVNSEMLMKDILALVCKKRKLNKDDYVLRMADTKTDVPMDKRLQSLKLTELCLLKKERGHSAGDIFLRPPDEKRNDSNDFQQTTFISTSEYASGYKTYIVMKKSPMFGGRNERVFAIDGDYVHIMPSEHKHIFDSVKTTSFHVERIITCLQSKKNSPHFKMSVQRDKDVKSFEFEAQSIQEASKNGFDAKNFTPHTYFIAEICNRIGFLMRKTKVGNINL